MEKERVELFFIAFSYKNEIEFISHFIGTRKRNPEV